MKQAELEVQHSELNSGCGLVGVRLRLFQISLCWRKCSGVGDGVQGLLSRFGVEGGHFILQGQIPSITKCKPCH